MTASLSDHSSWSFGSKRSLLRTARDRQPRKTKPSDDLKHFEESVFVRRAKAEELRKRRARERRFVYLTISAVAVLLFLAAHLTYQAVVGTLPVLRMEGQGMGQNKAIELSSFQLAGVSPGMTPAQVRKMHTDNTTQVSDLGITVTGFTFRDADVRVWHLGQTDGQQAFRIRSEQTFPLSREDDVLASLSVKFGRPNTTHCEKSNVTQRQDCLFSWRADSIDLKAETRITDDDRLSLVINAEDVRLRAIMQRNKMAR